jgi:hypothetical protein
VRFEEFDRWSVRFVGSLAAIAIGVPAITFGSVAYWGELTSSEVATASGTCSPARSTHVANGTRYIVEEFTDTSASCNWTVPAGVTEVDVLVVGGGGGGGNRIGGGGGGGTRIVCPECSRLWLFSRASLSGSTSSACPILI